MVLHCVEDCCYIAKVLLYPPARQAWHAFPPEADVTVSAVTFLACVLTSLCNTVKRAGDMFSSICDPLGTRLLRDDAVSLPLFPCNQTSHGSSPNMHYDTFIVSLCHRHDIQVMFAMINVYEDTKNQKHNDLYSAKCKFC